MSKKLYTMTVNTSDQPRLEKILNSLRIGLTDWDKSKVFKTDLGELVVYTIYCDNDEIVSISNMLYN